MKKIFTLIGALVGFASISSAATVDDIAVCKHSYVLCFDDWDGAGTAKPGKGALFGNGYFLDVTGGSVNAGGKGSVNLSVLYEADDNHVTQYIVDKYGADYPEDHYNSWRLKDAQDMIAMKVTAKSKLIFFLQGNNKEGTAARIPKIWDHQPSNKSEEALNAAPGEDHPKTDSGFRYEWIAPDDMTIFIGTYNGDTFFSYLIVEANEAPGTPTVKVGDQTYQDGLWFREVTCKANDMVEEGSTEKIPTIVTYTTDGSAPTAASTIYTAPIKCYEDMTLKFQAFMDFGDGKPSDDFICDGADNVANVNFKFDAPSIETDGANVVIVSPYENARNFLSLDGTESGAEELSQITLEESATIYAYSLIDNGDYTTFRSNSTTKDVYVLDAIKEKKTISVIAGDVVLDEEATASSTTGEVYMIENGQISADKKDFFVKNLTFKALKDEQYQVPAGNERYIQMSNTNITFFVAEGDSVDVKVICSKNSCKNIDADDAEDGSQVTDRKCYVNVSGTNYCLKDEEGNETNDLKLYPNANEFSFGLKGAEGGSYFTFQKYSGTGNILISSIEITPAAAEAPVQDLTAQFNYCWNEAESNTHNEDGTITYNAVQWGGLAAWLVVDDVPADWSAYTHIVFEFAEPTPCAVQPFIQYNDGTETKTWVEAGTKKAVGNLEAGKVAVKQAALQCSENTTLTITKIYLTNETAGIQGVVAEKVLNGVIYNLAGQKVDTSYKGVVIVNGKKMIQK